MKINHWFTGVVEDVNDPLQMGRVRVRCIDYHSGDTTDIKTEDLPWSFCLLPVTSPATSGIGQSATGLVPGSWVFGFFRDENEQQDAMIVGSLGSASGSFPPGVNSGFSDPNGFFPLTLGNDMPNGATTSGYNSQYGSPGVGDVAGAYGVPPSAFGPDGQRVIMNGSMNKVIEIAKTQLFITQTSKHQGPGIEKFWSATEYTRGYQDRAPWCGAFVCWCIQQSGILTNADRPKSASAFGFEAWAKSKPTVSALRSRPTYIKIGDLVVFSHSHIGIAITDSDGSGKFRTIDGNTVKAGGGGCAELNRTLGSVRSAITIGGAALQSAGASATITGGSIPGAWVKGLPNTSRGAGGLQFTSYGQPTDLNSITGDSNTRARRGFKNNLLSPGSVALSPDIYKKYNPQIGAEVFVNGRSVGYYEDHAPAAFKGMSYGSVIDIYDPDNKIGPILTNAGNDAKITFGPARAQVRNA